MSSIVGLIFARGGSKGVPRKNIRPLAGKPLIAYAIETAHKCPSLERVIVSTDDAEIASFAQDYGAEVPFLRPPELAMDDSPEWLSWKHAVEWLQGSDHPGISAVVSLPTTAPLRSPSDVEAVVEKLMTGTADVVITVKPAERNPYFNMVTLDTEGVAALVLKPPKEIVRRQDAPPVFDMATVAYAARPEFILRANSMYEGKTMAVLVPSERALDIDTEYDFQLAEFLLSRRKAFV